MRRIDALVGAPVCAALTLVRRAGRRSATPVGAPRRMLVVKLAEQGATVVAYPALRRAVDLVGAENLFMLVFEENRFILDELHLIPDANVLTVRANTPLTLAWDLLRALRRIRRAHIDAAVDFEFFSRVSAIITYLSGARRRAGYHSYFGEASYRGDLMTHRLAFNPLLHAGESFTSLIESVCHPPSTLPALPPLPVTDPQRPRARIDDHDRSEVRSLLEDVFPGAGRRRLVLLNANTGDLIPLRQWPDDRYVELARRLIAHAPDVVIAFTGARSEARAAEALARSVGSDRCVSLAGRTTMRQLLALYSEADAMVTNDSGPAHYATLTDLHVVTLFGPESPAVFGARSPNSHLIWASLPCSPCVNAFNDRRTACTNNLCMQAITTEEVFERARAALDGQR